MASEKKNMKPVDERKVMIKDNLGNRIYIIVTDAPSKTITKIAEKASKKMRSFNMHSLAKKYYVRIIYDSCKHVPEDEIAINYDECYSIWDKKEEFIDDTDKLLERLDEACVAMGLKILDGDRDSFIVKNPGDGPDWQVTVTET